MIAVAAFSLPAHTASSELLEAQPATLLAAPSSHCSQAAAASLLPLPRTSHLLRQWWDSQSLLASTLSLELGASLLRLLSSPASQHPLCSRYHADGGLFFDFATQRYWARLGNGDVEWIEELSSGDCFLCSPQADSCPPAAVTARPVPARCRSVCSKESSPLFSASLVPALHCSVCRQLELTVHTESAASLRLLKPRAHGPRRRLAVRQSVDDAMARFFSLPAAAAAFDLSAVLPASRLPSALFQSLQTDWWQVRRLQETLISAPQQLSLLYAAAANVSAAQLGILAPTPRTADSMFSLSFLDPPYSIATDRVESLLSSLPLQQLAELKGGGGGGGGFGWLVGCQREAGDSALDVLLTSGGGGGGGYRISGASREGRQEALRSLSWEGGGGIGAGLQFDYKEGQRASLLFTVGGGGGGGAALLLTSAGVSTVRREQGAAADRRLRLPPQSELAVLNASLSRRLRRCLHAGRPVMLTGGGGGGGGQRLLLRWLPAAEEEEKTVSAVASTRTALAAHFSLRVDLCLLATAVQPSAGCAAVLPFPHLASDPVFASQETPPAPHRLADDSPSPMESDSGGGVDGSLALQLSTRVRVCLQELGLPVKAVPGSEWQAALCPCLLRALSPVHALDNGAERADATPLFPCRLP